MKSFNVLIYLLLASTLLLSSCVLQNREAILFAQGQQNFAAHNYSQALQQLMPAALLGKADAEYAVGYIYYYGKGAPRNLDLARGWMKQSAAHGYLPAIKAMSMIDHSTFNADKIN